MSFAISDLSDLSLALADLTLPTYAQLLQQLWQYLGYINLSHPMLQILQDLDKFTTQQLIDYFAIRVPPRITDSKRYLYDNIVYYAHVLTRNQNMQGLSNNVLAAMTDRAAVHHYLSQLKDEELLISIAVYRPYNNRLQLISGIEGILQSDNIMLAINARAPYSYNKLTMSGNNIISNEARFALGNIVHYMTFEAEDFLRTFSTAINDTNNYTAFRVPLEGGKLFTTAQIDELLTMIAWLADNKKLTEVRDRIHVIRSYNQIYHWF